MRSRLLVRELATMALLVGTVASPAMAADPVRGKALYNNTNGAPLSCGTQGCHGPDPTQNINKVRNGSTGAAILKALNDVGAMSFLKPYVSAVDADDIAAYIVNPAAGTPMPVATLSTASLSFGNQVVMTASGTMSATLRNSGTANLVVSSITLAGTNPGDFTRGGTCAAATTLAPTQTCSIDVTFVPTVIGARSATITVAHNATPASSTLGLSGSGIAAPMPAVGLSATSLAFGNQTVGSTSAAKSVSVSNTGSASLQLGTIALTGTNSADFAATGCSGQTLAPGANCSVNVTFTPGALNARSATLSIPSNASGSPHGVALTGTGTAVPAPAVALNPTTLAFGNQTVGTTSAAKSVALTNSGNASLGITSITTSGAGFASTHNCPASLSAGASCSISVTFAPASVVAYTGSVSIASSAAGSPHSVGISGTGAAAVPLAPQVTLTPALVDFGSLPLNTPSGKRTISLANSGTGPLSLTALGLAGTNATDFAQSNDCPTGGTLNPGAACTVTLSFTPAATGARLASLTVTSNAPGAPAADLRGTGIVQASAVAQVAPTQAIFGNVRVGKTSDERKVKIRNAGTTPLVVSTITVTGDFVQSNECLRTLAPGTSCEVKVRFKPTSVGARLGDLSVASNAAGSPHAVKLSGTGTQKRSGDDDECDDDESSCSAPMLPFGPRRR